jgi:hypothetical protein
LIFPGCAVASAISSGTLFAGSDGCATITKLTATTWVSGAKSFCGSTVIFG